MVRPPSLPASWLFFDVQGFFLSHRGRIGRLHFVYGLMILFAVSDFVWREIYVGLLVQPLLIYSLSCLYSKRLHDCGFSGWWQALLWPLGVPAVVMPFYLLMAVIGPTSMPAAATRLVLSAAAFLLIVHTWLCVRRGTNGPNRYGLDPLDRALA